MATSLPEIDAAIQVVVRTSLKSAYFFIYTTNVQLTSTATATSLSGKIAPLRNTKQNVNLVWSLEYLKTIKPAAYCTTMKPSQ